jgi:hypothetical protein
MMNVRDFEMNYLKNSIIAVLYGKKVFFAQLIGCANVLLREYSWPIVSFEKTLTRDVN